MIFNAILVLVLIICFITDLRAQKIYNKVIYPALAAAVVAHGAIYGLSGLKLSVLGFTVGMGVLIIPYLAGGIGAGDVKLMALIGAIKGSMFALNTAIYMGLIGGIIAIVIILIHKETIRFFKTLCMWIFSLIHGNRYEVEFPTTVFLKKYPYGTAITGGALICLIFRGGWII